MKLTLNLFLILCMSVSCIAQESQFKVDDNEFKVGKTVVAKVKDVKLGFLMGRENRLLNSKDEVLLHLPTKTKTLSTNPPSYLNYVEIFIPSINDSIQISFDSYQADGGKVYGMSPNDNTLADYLFQKNIVNEDGSLNMESLKSLKERFPLTALQAHEKAAAEAIKCNNSLKPVIKDASVSAIVTETSRETTDGKVVIKYKVEHAGVLVGEIVGKGPAVNLTNERAEVDFKTKLIYKKADAENFPLAFDITNSIGCKVADYKPTTKRLYTVRADKGGWHGIMSPILDGKVETVKTRIEVLTAMINYLIKLGYY